MRRRAIRRPPESEVDRADLHREQKVRRAGLVSAGGQVVTLFAYLALPEEVSHWPPTSLEQYWRALGPNWRKAWTSPPVWDGDGYVINYVSHPLAGSYYHNALRSQGATPLRSFFFTVAESAVWEYVIESPLERPSMQDLVLTPTTGSLFGELTHRATLRMRRNGFSPLERIAVTILNPAYVLNRGYK